MSKINCSIDLNAIDKSKVVNHANGSKYYNFDVVEMKQPDQYGKTHTIVEARSKEEREAGVAQNYIGKGKEFIFGGSNNTAQPNNVDTPTGDEPDDLPF